MAKCFIINLTSKLTYSLLQASLVLNHSIRALLIQHIHIYFCVAIILHNICLQFVLKTSQDFSSCRSTYKFNVKEMKAMLYINGKIIK